MSAVTPINNFTRSRARLRGMGEVQAELRRLSFRRHLRQSCTWLTFALALAAVLLCGIGVVDNMWPLARMTRTTLIVSIVCGAMCVLIFVLLNLTKQRKLTLIAREIERVKGGAGNTLVTFAENTESVGVVVEDMFEPDVAPYMMARLERQARSELEQLDEKIIAPRRGATWGLAALFSVLLLTLLLRVTSPIAFARESRRVLRLERDEIVMRGIVSSGNVNGDSADMGAAIDGFSLRVVPPAYTGLAAEAVTGDAPVRALANSRIEATLQARGDFTGATLGFNGAVNGMRVLGDGAFNASFIANVSGTLEARLIAEERYAPSPIVRAVEIYQDAIPQARITEPSSDSLLREVPSAPIVVRWTASDDLGLGGVALKYIKSRGEGDAAKFTSGEAGGGNVERVNGREWRGAASLDLARLDVKAGDTFVFWIEARDRNPDANHVGRSASLAIAIASPEAAKLNLGELRPNEIGRFLLSERLIIMHTEKLHAERAHLVHDELMKRSTSIAAEQRDFKNSFNDFTEVEGQLEGVRQGESKSGAEDAGGAKDVEQRVREDEDRHTEIHNHGIPEPPAGSPASVSEMIYALRAMWDAEDALELGETGEALKAEGIALAHLKRAQAAVRYIPPVAGQGVAVDLKRRYAGELAEIKTRLEKLAPRLASKDSLELRAALADAYAALGDLQLTLNAPVSVRQSAIVRARERARQAANRLVAIGGGDHAATIAEAAGQLRVVETELAALESGGTNVQYAERISKQLALLTQAAANLFALADQSARASTRDATTLLPTDTTRAADYFRRLSQKR